MATESLEFFSLPISKESSGKFDFMENVMLSNRFSDVGIIEPSALMAGPRPGTSFYGNRIGTSGLTSDVIFFTGSDSVRRAYCFFGGKVWKLVGSTWTDTGITMSGADVRFNIVRLPWSSSDPTTYTTQASTAANRVKPDATDTSGLANVQKYLFFVNSPTTSPEYAFKFISSQISNFDAGEYVTPYLGSSGIITPAGLSYKVYDGLREYLQVSSSSDPDVYYDGVSVNTNFTGAAAYQFKIASGNAAMPPYPEAYVNYGGYMWGYYKNFLIGAPGTNPFNFEVTTLRSTQKTGDINTLFRWRKFLVVGSSDFVGYISFTTGSDIPELNTISNSYGIRKNTLIDLQSDAYFLSTNNELYSMEETFNGLILPTNVSLPVSNFIKDMNINTCSGFDGRFMYIYGEKDGTTSGYLLVFDIRYGWWYDWTGIRPSRIVCELGTTYFSCRDRGGVQRFDHSVFTDNTLAGTGDKITQRVLSDDQRLGNMFVTKKINSAYAWLDNKNQDLRVKIYGSTIRNNGTVSTTDWSFSEESVVPSTSGPGSLIGTQEYGDDTFGSGAVNGTIAYPNLLKIMLRESNEFSSFKIEVLGKDGSPFYLNELGWVAGVSESNFNSFPYEFSK